MAGEGILKTSKGGNASVNNDGKLILNNGSGTTCCCLPCPDGGGTAYLPNMLVTITGGVNHVGSCEAFGSPSFGSYFWHDFNINASFCVPYLGLGDTYGPACCRWYKDFGCNATYLDVDVYCGTRSGPCSNNTCYGTPDETLMGFTIQIDNNCHGEFSLQAGMHFVDCSPFRADIATSLFALASGGTATTSNTGGLGQFPEFSGISITVSNVASC